MYPSSRIITPEPWPCEGNSRNRRRYSRQNSRGKASGGKSSGWESSSSVDGAGGFCTTLITTTAADAFSATSTKAWLSCRASWRFELGSLVLPGEAGSSRAASSSGNRWHFGSFMLIPVGGTAPRQSTASSRCQDRPGCAWWLLNLGDLRTGGQRCLIEAGCSLAVPIRVCRWQQLTCLPTPDTIA